MKKPLMTATLAAMVGFGSYIAPSVVQPVQVEAAALLGANAQTVQAKADDLIRTAKSLIGKSTYSTAEYKPTYPYKFSCATFLMYVFEKEGVDLGTYNEDYMMQMGTYVSRNNLQKGDLVFFRSKTTAPDPDHVGMYIGDNKVIHMADSKQNIIISDLNSKSYYTDNYLSARRVLPTLMSSANPTAGESVTDTAFALKSSAKMGSIDRPASNQFTPIGFIGHVYQTNHISLQASSYKTLMSKGTTVSKNNLQKGDLVFFNSVKGSSNPTMAAIYAGDHRLIIPTADGIISRVLLVDYYQDHYITAKRVTSAHTAPSVPGADKKADELIAAAGALSGTAKFGYSYDERNHVFTSAGFTYYAYKQIGVDLKYKLAEQQSKLGSAVQKSALQKGDLLFFSTDNKGKRITQTGIYAGGNQFITLHVNGKVSKESMSGTWAARNYISARRVIK